MKSPAWACGVLLGVAMASRTAFDWPVPPVNFQTRAALTTYAAAVLFVAAGFLAVRHSRSLAAAASAAVRINAIASVISVAAAAAMFAIWNDPQTRQTVAHSGGLSEQFWLPMFLFAPAMLLASIGGFLAKLTLSLNRAT